MRSIPLTADIIRGASEIEHADGRGRLHRLPTWVRHQFPDPQLLAMEAQPAGIRLTFRTCATEIELVMHSRWTNYVGLSRPRGTVDVLIDGELAARNTLTGGDVVEFNMLTGAVERRSGEHCTTHVTGLPSAEKTIEMWLPHNESMDLVSLHADAPVSPVTDNAQHRWTHYGSSISQGSNAAAPSETWTSIASRRLGLDLENLGFGGSAVLDPFMARVIRDSPAEVISIKIGVNIANTDSMRLRSFVPAVHGFLDTIRDGHPETPLLVMSPLYCGLQETTPGPLAMDPEALAAGTTGFLATGDEKETSQGRLTLEVIRDALDGVFSTRSTSDPHLHYLDGIRLFGAADADRYPLADGLHPDAPAHHLIGERFVEYAHSDSSAFSHLAEAQKLRESTAHA